VKSAPTNGGAGEITKEIESLSLESAEEIANSRAE
jgi:hypothetical protein